MGTSYFLLLTDNVKTYLLTLFEYLILIPSAVDVSICIISISYLDFIIPDSVTIPRPSLHTAVTL